MKTELETHEISIYLNYKEFKLQVSAKNLNKAEHQAKRFFRDVFLKRKSRLYNELMLVDESLFYSFINPDKYKTNKLKKYGIFLETTQAIEIVNTIREINTEIYHHGGKKKRLLARTLFPVYKFSQDTKSTVLDAIDIFTGALSLSSDLYNKEIREYSPEKSIRGESKVGAFGGRIALNLIAIAILLTVIYINTYIIIKITSICFVLLMFLVNFMPFIITRLKDDNSIDQRDEDE